MHVKPSNKKCKTIVRGKSGKYCDVLHALIPKFTTDSACCPALVGHERSNCLYYLRLSTNQRRQQRSAGHKMCVVARRLKNASAADEFSDVCCVCVGR
jgi:hypothetical protein